ncbi:MAG: phosphate ABC transporter, permease protein PstA, partial [Anaerolineae bacterium]
MSRQTTQKIAFATLTILAIIVVLPIVLVVVYIIAQGIRAISWEFISGFPRSGMREGGILPAIIGTLVLTFGTAIAA